MLTKIEFEVYAILWKKFGQTGFSTKELRFLDIFLTPAMKKKVLFSLSQKGWIKRVKRGRYACISPDQNFKEVFKPKILSLLRRGEMRWRFSKLNALEIYTDFAVTHRSWLSSPYYINVLKKDLRKWLNLFKKHGTHIFVNEAKSSLGEYVILLPKEKLEIRYMKGFPVEPFKDVMKFVQQNPFEFEYELNYLHDRYGVELRET